MASTGSVDAETKQKLFALQANKFDGTAEGAQSTRTRLKRKKTRPRRDFRVSVALAHHSLLSKPAEACTAVTAEGKYFLNLRASLAPDATRPHSAGRRVERRYIFDGVLPWAGDVAAIHADASKAVVSAANRGYHGSVIVCGQEGCRQEELFAGAADGDGDGLLAHAADQMLAYEHTPPPFTNDTAVFSATSPTSPGADAVGSTFLAISAVAVYGDMVDLLATVTPDHDPAELQIVVDRDGTTQINGLERKLVSNLDEARHMINRAIRCRKRYFKTALQPLQTLFFMEMVRLKKKRSNATATSLEAIADNKSAHSVTGKLTLALLSPITGEDVDADERARRAATKSASPTKSPGSRNNYDFSSGSEDDEDGDEAHQTPAIRAFMQVMRVLTTKQGDHDVRVPYRSSNLTRLLRDTLGGNCRTNIIFTVRPSTADAAHAARLLEFASSARDVHNQAVVSKKFKAERALLVAYRKQLGLPDIDEPSSMSDETDPEAEQTQSEAGDDPSQSKARARVYRKAKQPPVQQRQERQGPAVERTEARGHAAVEFPEEAAWGPIEGAGAVDLMPDPFARPPPTKGGRKHPGGRPGASRARSNAPAACGGVSPLPALPEMPSFAPLPRQASAAASDLSADQARSGGADGPDPSFDPFAHPSAPLDPAAQRAAEERREWMVKTQTMKAEYESKLEAMAEKHKSLLGVVEVLEAKSKAAEAAAGSPPVLETLAGGDAAGAEKQWTSLVSQMAAPEGGVASVQPDGADCARPAEFTGSAMLDWLCTRYVIEDRADAVVIGESLVDIGAIMNVEDASGFSDGTDSRYIFSWAEQQTRERELIAALEEAEAHGFGFEEDQGGQIERLQFTDQYHNEAAIRDEPLLFAIATQKKSSVVKTFLQATRNPNTMDDLERTAVAYAVIAESEDVLQLLIKAGGDVNHSDVFGHTPLLWAAYRGLPKLMSILLKHGAILEIPDALGRTPIHWATRLGSTACLKVLLKHCAVAYGDGGVYNINMQDRSEHLTALHWAVAAKNKAAARLLLEVGADVTVLDSRGRNVFNYANFYQSMDCLKEILSHHPEAISQRDSLGCTVLHFAAGEYGSKEIISALLQQPFVDVNANDVRLRSALHWAATYNQTDTITLLLMNGARRDHRDVFGRLPLDLAVLKGNVEAVQVLEGDVHALQAACENRAEDPESQEHCTTLTAESELLRSFKSVAAIKVAKNARYKAQTKQSKACTIS